jgi:hypothetical protein
MLMNLQGDLRPGGHEQNSRGFHLTMEKVLRNIMQGSVPSDTKEETTYSGVRAGNVGALITVKTFGSTDHKERDGGDIPGLTGTL